MNTMRKMMMCWFVGCVSSLAMSVQLLAVGDVLPGASRSFGATADNFMYSDAVYASKNWGGHANLVVGLNNDSATYRSLVRFDISSLEDAVNVSSATLTLTVASAAKIHPENGSFNLNLLLMDPANNGWVGGTANNAVESGASCWNYLAHDSISWSGNSGIGTAAASEGISALLDGLTINPSSVTVGETLSFTIDSPEGLAAIESWINGGDNAGFLLVTDELSGGQNAMIFYSSNATDESVRPMLEIRSNDFETEFSGLQVDANSDTVSLWSIPTAANLKPLDGVEFCAIKAYEPQNDGFEWLHGVGLMWHNDQLYASFGHNAGVENSQGEMARYRVSDDEGKTWGEVKTIAVSEGTQSVSHGVFLSHAGQLWAFQGAFYDDFQRTHTRAYLLNEATDEWEPQGGVVDDGFWPMQQPEKMADGNWMMAGLCAPKGFPLDRGGEVSQDLPAVAISHGDDLTQWDLVVVQLSDGLGDIWGESNVIVNGSHLTMISRWWWETPFALVAESADYGRTWTPLKATNLPMAASKPCAGMLSTGQRYLIANISADGENRRDPLTIAYSRPSTCALSEIRLIRNSVQEGTPWSEDGCKLSYPCAIEKDGKLYVGYSNSAFSEGVNNNNAELAVIPISALQ